MAARIAAQHDTAAPRQRAGAEPVREVPSTRLVLLHEFGDLIDHAEVPSG